MSVRSLVNRPARNPKPESGTARSASARANNEVAPAGCRHGANAFAVVRRKRDHNFSRTGPTGCRGDEVVALAGQLGGSATKGLPDEHRIGLLVDIPSNRESEFRAAIGSVGGAKPETSAVASQEPGSAPPATAEKKSFVVQIVETTTKRFTP